MSTISNERLEKLSEYDCADRYEVMSMATELLALRKEREKEESAVCPKCGNTGLADSGGVQPWGEPILIECDCTAPPAPAMPDVERMKEIYSLFCTPTTGSDNAMVAIHKACRAAMRAAPPAPVVPDEITADFKLVSRKKCMKCDQTVFGYTVNGLCEECYMSEQAIPVLPECLERLLRHAQGLTSGTDWNAGTAAKFHRDPLIQAVKDCRAIFTRQPLSVDVLAGALRKAPLAPSDNQGRQRETASPQGWKLVPEEPTQEMIQAAMDCEVMSMDTVERDTYKAMLAATPGKEG
ncbi:hypothetical protein QMS90_20300 [Cronobacter sakazakii]